MPEKREWVVTSRDLKDSVRVFSEDAVVSAVREYVRRGSKDVDITEIITIVRPREWYVYVPVHRVVLSGYMTESEARDEASRVLKEWPEAAPFEVLHRSHTDIKEYARTHPAWAEREGFASSSPNPSSGQEIREGDVGTLAESIMAMDIGGRSHRIPAGVEVKIMEILPSFIKFSTREMIEGNRFFTAIPFLFKDAFRKRSSTATNPERDREIEDLRLWISELEHARMRETDPKRKDEYERTIREARERLRKLEEARGALEFVGRELGDERVKDILRRAGY